MLIAGLKVIEYRWLVVERSVEIYGGLIAAIFAGVGLWLGLKLTRHTETVVVREVMVPAPAPFVRDHGKLESLGITPRELEILELIAAGLSTREARRAAPDASRAAGQGVAPDPVSCRLPGRLGYAGVRLSGDFGHSGEFHPFG